MTNKEKEIQRALGLLKTYCFILQVPPEDGFGWDAEVGIQIEAFDLDSACTQLKIEVKEKYPRIEEFNINIDRAPSLYDD